MAGHAQLKFVMTECSKTQIRLTGLICQCVNHRLSLTLHMSRQSLRNHIHDIHVYPTTDNRRDSGSEWSYRRFSQGSILSYEKRISQSSITSTGSRMTGECHWSIIILTSLSPAWLLMTIVFCLMNSLVLKFLICFYFSIFRKLLFKKAYFAVGTKIFTLSYNIL